MTDRELLAALERHDVASLSAASSAGALGPRLIEGRSAVEWLLEFYTRSTRFPECLRILLASGGRLPHPMLAAVLLDDPDAVHRAVVAAPGAHRARFDLRCAYTPLRGATALHIAVEYGLPRAAKALLAAGADIEARSQGEEGRGPTPVFHAVNQYSDVHERILDLLLDAGAATDARVERLTWGSGFEWETTMYDLTPVSYAQCGLLPQLHRDELRVHRTIARLLAAAGRPPATLANVPNRYLAPRRPDVAPDGEAGSR